MRGTLTQNEFVNDFWTMSRFFTIFGIIDFAWMQLALQYRRNNKVVPWYLALPFSHETVLRELSWAVIFGFLAAVVSLN